MFTDVDECEQPGVCHGGRCTNTEGSYHCQCDQGYIMVRKGHCQGKKWDKRGQPASPPPLGPSPGAVCPHLPACLPLGPLMLSPLLGQGPVWEFMSLSVPSVTFWPVCPPMQGSTSNVMYMRPREHPSVHPFPLP